MKKKFDRNTRQGRARRDNRTDLFNPDTGLPHGKAMRAELHKDRDRRRKMKALKTKCLLDPREEPVYDNRGRLRGYRRLTDDEMMQREKEGRHVR